MKYLFLVIILIIAIPSYFLLFEAENEPESSVLTKEEQAELDEFITFLNEEDGFFDQVGEELKKEGYTYQTAGTIFSKENIQVAVIIPNNEEVTEKLIEEILAIYQQEIEAAELDPNAFQIQIGHSEDINW